MENRKEDRQKKHIRLRLRDGDETYAVTATGISRKGMSLLCEKAFPTYKQIDILCKIAHRVIPVKGSVRWVNELPQGEEKKYEVGIALTNPPQEYIDHFE